MANQARRESHASRHDAWPVWPSTCVSSSQEGAVITPLGPPSAARSLARGHRRGRSWPEQRVLPNHRRFGTPRNPRDTRCPERGEEPPARLLGRCPRPRRRLVPPNAPLPAHLPAPRWGGGAIGRQGSPPRGRWRLHTGSAGPYRSATRRQGRALRVPLPPLAFRSRQP